MITNIDVTKLKEHPDNPRKNIGDVTELAESIKARGILQNLTVVPAENGMYTVIIGHRRLAAAKQAGLTEVPCAVIEMDYKTQLSTMLLENMQRSDLTVYEQAQGMQMMFNLGVPVAEIVEKTGFAETTVRKRLKIATLPTEQMQQAVERGGTLENYVQIADIKDEKERRELLKVVGTREFEFSLTRAKRRQIEAEKTPLVKAELKAIGAKAVKNQIYSSAYDWIERCEIADWKEGTFKKPKNKEELFWEISYGTVYLMRKKAKASKKKEEKSECELRIDSANRELMRLTKTAYECRVNFVKNFTAVEKHKETIIKWLVMFAGCEITDYCTYDRAYMTSFDITPTQADKIMQRYTAEPPEAFLKMVKDEFDGEERCDPLPISLRIGSYDYIPYKTSAGIEFVESKYLEPLDVDEFELYYRQTAAGAFFAAKAGFFVMAIIPISTTRVLTENTVGYLDELSSMSSIKYENLK